MKSCDTVPLSHLEKYFSEITFLLLFQHSKFSLSKSKHVKICGQKKSIEISWFVSFNIFWLLEYLKSISKEYRSNRIKSLIFKMTLGFSSPSTEFHDLSFVNAQFQTRFRNSLNSTSRRRTPFSSNPQITKVIVTN